jgi:hypothetical protein
MCWCTRASSSLPSPLLCSISSSFLMLSSRACRVCFCVSIRVSSSFIVSFRMATSRVKWSFSSWRPSICALISGFVSLACCRVFTTSSSNWRTNMACFWFSELRSLSWSLIRLYLADSSLRKARSFLSSGLQKVLILCILEPNFWLVSSSSFRRLPKSLWSSELLDCSSPMYISRWPLTAECAGPGPIGPAPNMARLGDKPARRAAKLGSPRIIGSPRTPAPLLAK